jgi:hypothetical protein
MNPQPTPASSATRRAPAPLRLIKSHAPPAAGPGHSAPLFLGAEAREECGFGHCALEPACTGTCRNLQNLYTQRAIAAYQAEAGEAQRREALAREVAALDAQARLLARWVVATFAVLIAAYAFGPDLLLWLRKP